PRPTQRAAPTPVASAARNKPSELVRHAARYRPFRAARKAAVAHRKIRVRSSYALARAQSRRRQTRRRRVWRSATGSSQSQLTCLIMQLVPRQVGARDPGPAPAKNCRTAILAANEKETAAKIATVQLVAADMAGSTGITEIVLPIARKEMNIRPRD